MVKSAKGSTGLRDKGLVNGYGIYQEHHTPFLNVTLTIPAGVTFRNV